MEINQINLYCDRMPGKIFTKNCFDPNQLLEDLIMEYIEENTKGIYFSSYKIYDYDTFFQKINPNNIPTYISLGELETNNLFLTLI